MADVLITYHPGGFDPQAPAQNKAEEYVDNLDGTGTRTTWDTDGNQLGVENLTGLEIPEPAPPTEAERLADLEAFIEALAAP